MRNNEINARQKLLRQAILIAISLANESKEFGELVLKGACAAELLYGDFRFSQDIDYSHPDSIANPKKCKENFTEFLQDTLGERGYKILRLKWNVKPEGKFQQEAPFFWRGHQIQVDVISMEEWEKIIKLPSSLKEKDRRFLDPQNYLRYRIDISEHEYTKGHEQKILEGYTIKVYTSAMIVAEKLRAICQQIPEYPQRFHKKPKPRARDFYDIYQIMQRANIHWNKSQNSEILQPMFKAKEVELESLARIKNKETKTLHSNPSELTRLKDTVTGQLREFDFYYDYVVNLAEEILGNIHSTCH